MGIAVVKRDDVGIDVKEVESVVGDALLAVRGEKQRCYGTTLSLGENEKVGSCFAGAEGKMFHRPEERERRTSRRRSRKRREGTCYVEGGCPRCAGVGDGKRFTIWRGLTDP